MTIRLALDYSSNFKVNLKGSKKQKKIYKKYQLAKTFNQPQKLLPSPRVVCKHAILMLMHFHNNGNIIRSNRSSFLQVESLSFLFKKTKKKYFTLLRAPYRYKIARNQILFKRFFFRCIILLKVATTTKYLKLVSSHNSLLALDQTLTTLYTDLDTNMCIQNKVKLSLPFTYTNFFLIKNYN